MRRAGSFPDLPNYKSRQFSHYLYAAEFADGVVKVGCTWSPQQRLRQLVTHRKRGVRRVAYVGLPGGTWFLTERVALAACRSIAAKTVGKEWFHGLRFGEAVTAIKHAARRSVS